MPRRSILSVTERDSLLALPDTEDGLIRYYTFSDSDQSLIGQRRGNPNRLGWPSSSACFATWDKDWRPMLAAEMSTACSPCSHSNAQRLQR